MKQKEQQRKERKANKSGMAANGKDEDNSKTGNRETWRPCRERRGWPGKGRPDHSDAAWLVSPQFIMF